MHYTPPLTQKPVWEKNLTCGVRIAPRQMWKMALMFIGIADEKIK
jgi:hypothetical protein